MYSRRRKARYLARIARVGANTKVAGFWPVIIFLIIFSCAHKFEQHRVDQADKTLSKAISSLCFSGEGKGRLRFRGKTASYTFESKKNGKEWLIAFRIPFHGEEILRLNGIGGGNVSAQGSFYQRIKANVNDPRERRLIKEFIRSLSAVIEFEKKRVSCLVTRKNEYEIKGVCGKQNWSISPRSLDFVDGDFHLKTFDLSYLFYQRMELSYYQDKQELIGMDLVFESCFAD